jgi:hypothetical protein
VIGNEHPRWMTIEEYSKTNESQGP